MSVSDDISILTRLGPPAYYLEREFAAIRFCGWLNWPTDELVETNLSIVLLLHAIRLNKKHGITWDASGILNQIDAETILNRANLDSLMFLPIFQDIDPSQGWFQNHEYIADIVRFLLSFNVSKSRDNNLKASLGKASYFINQLGGFPGDERVRKRSNGWVDSNHQVVWKRYKQTAAFQFVRSYGSGIEWMIDPTDKNLLQTLQAVAADGEQLRTYFAKCEWVQDRLKSILDRRSMSLPDYIQFPSDLMSIECQIPAKPRRIMAKMADYKRSRSALDSE